ncbi:GH92 family glycosyl hydrolase [uncultured Lutibacter sp.]|uniref:GH92 family glycosyl hydrolase n=1 Tax=uncultured Lutibacter sp. TaxID=437739 RepID=UPI0026173DDA|nr:GH92 family glycosyl hydrolase [uncultured Lutibacter sp.]
MSELIPIIFLFLLALSCNKSEKQKVVSKDYTQFVNTFIGTDGTGHTFPGPSMPFGMVQPGPDNRDEGWSHTSGYQYKDSLLLGFSQTRLNGTGISEMGDILLMPYNETKKDLSNRYFKNTEKAEVGYYSLLKKDSVKVELTATNRVAVHKYTFPTQEAKVLVDLQHGLRFIFEENQKGLVVESDVKIENNTTISGYCATSNWVKRKYFFTLTFDQTFIKSEELEKGVFDKAPKFELSFQLNTSKILKVKIALSSVSVDGAKQNMVAEMPQWDFEKVKQDAKNVWNAYLGRIDIDAPSKQKEIFYTSLYRVFLQPSNMADVDGKYRGADDKIVQAPNNEYYSTLSIWDVYRGAFPLLQIIAPEKIDGIVNSMLIHQKATGFLPIWTVWGQDNYCMIGNHAIPMILSASKNGFKGFDKNEALKAMIETSTNSHQISNWELYNMYGYYPFDKVDNEAVSRTLEHGYDDWCVAEMAKDLGNLKTSEIFTKRSNYYKNLYDPSSKMMRGMDTKGKWRTPFDPLIATSPMNNPGDYTEANAWQYFWTPAQYDINGMKNLLGGEDAFTKQLNDFFTIEAKNPNKFLGQEAMIGQYAHGNEPSHHIAYLYAFSNSPKTGQKYIHKIINEFHNNTPDGMIGNDDCGQMSAWYVLSSLGFYPVNPANSEFVLGAPQLKEATINLKGGIKFKITAKNISEEAIYTEKAMLNDKVIENKIITYSQIMKDGFLKFEMTKN